jgi:hypothetical protein
MRRVCFMLAVGVLLLALVGCRNADPLGALSQEPGKNLYTPTRGEH